MKMTDKLWKDKATELLKKVIEVHGWRDEMEPDSPTGLKYCAQSEEGRLLQEIHDFLNTKAKLQKIYS